MKKLLAFSAIVVCILIAGCEKPEGPKKETKPKELADPELTINGVPGAALESGASFTVTIESKSNGAISLTVDKPTVAIATAKSERVYEITAASPEDAKVKITVSQAEEPKAFKAAKAEASFSVKGSGGSSLPGPDDAISGTEVVFTEADGDVVGPERGLYSAYEVYSNTEPISVSGVKSKLATGHSLWLLEFYLTDFMSGSISSSYMQKIQECFDAIRSGGAKAIVRFAYRNTDANWSSVDQEPKVDQTLKHVEQLKPVLSQNEDVLFALQAGFIGSWGEWYYTTYFQSLQNRKKLVEALLEAVPSSRQIQLRTPTFKMKMYDITLKDTLTAATAHDGSIASRLAGHNDCFGADKNDKGTFDSEVERTFWKEDTKYTIMGGETCAVSDYCLCPATLKDLEDYHWTYLHDGYHQGVLARWKTDGCFDEIQARLGYRLVLKDVHYDNISAGQKCKVTIRLFNKGFAAPMNPREAWLVWVTPDGTKEKSLLGADPRTWQPGYNAVVSSFTPSTAKGTLYLELSDPLLSDNPAYSMPFANKDVFEATTGLNKLFEVK